MAHFLPPLRINLKGYFETVGGVSMEAIVRLN